MPDILSFDSGRTAAALCQICLRLEIRRRFLIQVFRYHFRHRWWRSIFLWLWQRLHWLNIDNARAALDAKMSVKASG